MLSSRVGGERSLVIDTISGAVTRQQATARARRMQPPDSTKQSWTCGRAPGWTDEPQVFDALQRCEEGVIAGWHVVESLSGIDTCRGASCDRVGACRTGVARRWVLFSSLSSSLTMKQNTAVRLTRARVEAATAAAAIWHGSCASTADREEEKNAQHPSRLPSLPGKPA